MGNVQVRLPDDLEQALEEFADQLHTNRSEVMRNALADGLASMRVDRALSRYGSGDVSLEAAAREAGVSLARMAHEAAQQGLPFFRYGAQAAQADRRAAAELLAEDPEDDEDAGDREGTDAEGGSGSTA